jgi:hypothetical protein
MKNQKIFIFWLFCLVGFMAQDAFGQSREPIDLSSYTWKNRLLFIFAPSSNDPNYESLREEIQTRKLDVADRDMLVFKVFETGESRFDDAPLSKDSTEFLRQKFSIKPGQFAILLIGKDGGEKLRRESKVDLAEIFSVIDAMPMRQQEIRERKW